MSKTRIAALGFALLVILGFLSLVLFDRGVLVFPNNGDDELAAEFATAVLTRKDLRTYEDLDGILEYGESVQISPSGSGVLTYIAPEGSELGRGSVVFRLYRSTADTEILIADQQIASASAAVAQAQLALENLNASATPAQIASADAAVSQAQLALDDLNAPATAAQIASANAAVAQAQFALDDLNAPATPAQIASADAAVAQAKLALGSLIAPATPAQIASADAAVAQAQLALENLSAPATPAQIASADAAVAQAQLALENLTAPATPSQIASANAAVAQAEAGLVTAQGGVETAWASRRIARNAYCDRGLELFTAGWVFLDPILCPASDVPLTDSAMKTLLDTMFTVVLMVTESNNLLSAHRSYQSAVASSASAADSLSSARTNLAALDDPPTATELAQASESLKSAQEQRAALDSPPTAAQLAQASESLKSAQEQRAALDDPPIATQLAHASESLKSAQERRAALNDPPAATQLAQASESLRSAQERRAALHEPPAAAQLAQASESLKSAQEQRAAFDDLPTATELAQAEASLESARASLNTAWAIRNGLIEGPSAGLLMFGELPAWREFRDGMEPGEDVRQLKENLISLGYGSTELLQVDQIFDTGTADAVKRMQVDLGLAATGRIAFGDAIFLPGTSVVGSSLSFPNLGAAVNPGTTLVSLIPIERIETQTGQNGVISVATESLQRVKTSIEVADQDLIDVGSEVKIELPDESMVSGTVRAIGSIAVVPQGGQAGNPYLEVSVAIDGNPSLPEWTGAPVTVSITKKLASNVLAAPVTSLLALLDGGYALEVLEPESTRLVPVETGAYADGWVEVDGSGLEAGTEVVAP